jgi:hypothetical protein
MIHIEMHFTTTVFSRKNSFVNKENWDEFSAALLLFTHLHPVLPFVLFVSLFTQLAPDSGFLVDLWDDQWQLHIGKAMLVVFDDDDDGQVKWLT